MSVESPCIGTCALDASGEVCVGCGRTRAEIAAWSVANGDQRRAIRAQAERRLADMAAAGRRGTPLEA